MVLAKKQKYKSMEQDRKPRDKPTFMDLDPSVRPDTIKLFEENIRRTLLHKSQQDLF